MHVFVDLLSSERSTSKITLLNFICENLFHLILSTLKKRLPFITKNWDFNLVQVDEINNFLHNYRYSKLNKSAIKDVLRLAFIIKDFLVVSKLIFVRKKKLKFEYYSNHFFFSMIFDIFNANKVVQVYPATPYTVNNIYRISQIGKKEGLIRYNNNLEMSVKLSKSFILSISQIESMRWKISRIFFNLLLKLDKLPLAESKDLNLPFPTANELLRMEIKIRLGKHQILSRENQKKARQIRSSSKYLGYDLLTRLICMRLGITLEQYQAHVAMSKQ